MAINLTEEELRKRVRTVIDRIGFIPRKIDIDFLHQVPYWNELIEDAEKNFPGGFIKLLESATPPDYFSSVEVEVPSLEQKLVGAQIAQRRKVLELSQPGTRKSISALSAILPIEENFFPNDERIKTFITCPSYILPNWIREIEKLFVEPNVVVITRENRDMAIERSADPSKNFILVGYDMTFRQAHTRNGANGHTNRIESDSDIQRYFELFSKFSNTEEIYNYLELIVGKSKTEVIKERRLNFSSLIKLLATEEAAFKERQEEGAVIEALKKRAFKDGSKYYAIVDEFHNIVNDETKRGQAIASIVRPATWTTLISGTGIGNTPEGLAWGAYALGFVDDPRDFRQFIRSSRAAQKITAFLDMYAVHPIKKLSDVDPQVKEPIIEVKKYELTRAETELFAALLNATEFDGMEKYTLFRYLIANPHKLLPEKFNHLNSGEDSLHSRIVEFYDNNPGLEDLVRQTSQSRIEHIKKLVGEIKAKGEKALVVCEYQRDITEELEKSLNEFGARRIDQTVSAELSEIKITEDEVRFLNFKAEKNRDREIFRGDETYRSDLSAKAKKILNMKPYEIYGMSDREIIMHEFATNPDLSALVSTRVLREGVELKEAVYIVKAEDTTVPSKDTQFNGRTIRSGQHRQTYIWEVRSPLLSLIEDYIEGKRLERQFLSDVVLDNSVEKASDEELQEWADDITTERSLVRTFKSITVREILGNHFNWLEGAGSHAYSETLRSANNAMFIASLYNTNRQHSTVGNIAKLTGSIISALEKRKGISLEKIVDTGCGPLAVANETKRTTIGIDMNRYMIEYGIDECDEQGIKNNRCFLGDISDLTNLIPFDNKEVNVFEPGKKYNGTIKLEDGSQDLIVSSMVLDLLDNSGRRSFFNEAYRVLGEGKYIVVVLPSKKIEESCRATFIQDFEKCGYSNLEYLTGTYQGYKGGKAEKVDAYVIVGMKNSANLSKEAPSLRLRPETIIVEGSEHEKKKARKRRKEFYVDAEYFIKLESGLDLKNVIAEQPLRYEDKIDSLSEESNDEDITALLAQIRAIAGESG